MTVRDGCHFFCSQLESLTIVITLQNNKSSFLYQLAKKLICNFINGGNFFKYRIDINIQIN